MWWFITYCIIAFAVYTTAYFYLFERYFDELNEDVENIDYSKFEDQFFENVRNGKKYQHFLNLMPCQYIEYRLNGRIRGTLL